MMVLCRKRGLVPMSLCSKAGCWEDAGENHPYGNSPTTCYHFGKIVRSREEQAQLGVEFKKPFGAEQKKGDSVVVNQRQFDARVFAKRDPRLAFNMPPPVDPDWYLRRKRKFMHDNIQ